MQTVVAVPALALLLVTSCADDPAVSRQQAALACNPPACNAFDTACQDWGCVVDPGGGKVCDVIAQQPAGTVCIGAESGACSDTDLCDDLGNCIDHHQPVGTVCRGSAGVCDVEEFCTGTSSTCPADTYFPATAVCRASTDACDSAENCTGSAAACPANGFLPASTVCRASTGVCDAAESCTGSGAACPADAPEPDGQVCRAAGGPCDMAEGCISGVCPSDAFSPAGAACRAAAGPCDAAEICSGTSTTCPADAFLPSSTECRAVAGPCDVPESCSGAGLGCPPDMFQPPMTVCRASAGVCDTAENCTGSGASCPADTLLPTTTVCRPSVSDCDTAETCPGDGPSCPTNLFAADGTGCNDGGACTLTDTCVAGACVGMNPVIAVTPSLILFPDTPTGSAAYVPVMVHNSGATPIGILAITSSEPEFPLSDLPSFPTSLAGGTDLPVTASFTPSAPGTFLGLLTVETDDPGCAAFTVPMIGVGQLPGISVTPFGWDAGPIALGYSAMQQFTVRNTGVTSYMVTGVSIDDTTNFILDASMFPTTLVPDATATFDITASPLTAGVHSATVTITTTIPGTLAVTLTVSAEGTCIGTGCDGGPALDAGQADADGGEGDGSGCDCRVAGSGAPRGTLVLLAFAGIAVGLVRRRRR